MTGRTIDPLTRLAIKYGTDKFGYHDYTPNYYALFRHLKDAPVRLLEIGVGGYQDADRGGESLEVWRDFFPNGQIVGLDIQKKEMDLGPRVTILQGSQVDAGFLAEAVRAHGPFDIIIDDGSHQNEHVVTSFGLLFQTLAAGGIYVAEDVQTSFFPRFGGSLEMEAPNSVGFFRDLFSALATGGDIPKNAENIARIERFHNMVAIAKAPLAEGRATSEKHRLLVGPSGRTQTWQKDHPELSSTSLEVNDIAPEHDILAALPGVQDGFYEIIDLSDCAASSIVPSLFTVLATGGTLQKDRLSSADIEWLGQRFVEVDHREIVVHFPEFTPGDLAREIYSLIASPGAVTLFKAPNDYPSNFGFDYQHPQALAAFDAMETVLMEEGDERGLLLFTDIMTRAKNEQRAAPMLKKLGEMGARSRVFFNVAVRRAKLDKDWDRAMELLLQAVSLYPEDYRIRSQLGSLYAKARDWSRAEAELQKGVDLAPRDPLLRIQLANAVAQLGRQDEAVSAAKTAVKLAPNHAGHHVQLARLQINAGACDDALDTLERAISIDPTMPHAYRQQSRAQFELGQLDDARAAIRVALDLRPASAEFQRWQDRLASA